MPPVTTMDVILVHPEIPHNSGCAGRLCAAVGACLHLVEPLGFSLEDRYLKRAGLDYWPMVDLVLHNDLEACWNVLERGSERPMAERARLFSARGGVNLFEVEFRADDVLFFGSESAGLPPELLGREELSRVYVPIREGVRSLNLANTVSVALYTAMVSSGVPLPDNSGRYEPHPQAQVDIRPQHVVRRPR